MSEIASVPLSLRAQRSNLVKQKQVAFQAEGRGGCISEIASVTSFPRNDIALSLRSARGRRSNLVKQKEVAFQAEGRGG